MTYHWTILVCQLIKQIELELPDWCWKIIKSIEFEYNDWHTCLCGNSGPLVFLHIWRHLPPDVFFGAWDTGGRGGGNFSAHPNSNCFPNSIADDQYIFQNMTVQQLLTQQGLHITSVVDHKVSTYPEPTSKKSLPRIGANLTRLGQAKHQTWKWYDQLSQAEVSYVSYPWEPPA